MSSGGGGGRQQLEALSQQIEELEEDAGFSPAIAPRSNQPAIGSSSTTSAKAKFSLTCVISTVARSPIVVSGTKTMYPSS